MAVSLDSAREETERLVRLANDLLVLARAPDGRLELHRQSCELTQLVDATAAAHRAYALAHHVEIVARSDGPAVAIDGVRVRQALDNLVGNAVRHSPEHTTITITAHVRETYLHLIVADQGSGYPTPITAGLGLRIAAAIAHSHGGKLVTENPAEGGAHAELILGLATDRRRVRRSGS